MSIIDPTTNAMAVPVSVFIKIVDSSHFRGEMRWTVGQIDWFDQCILNGNDRYYAVIPTEVRA